jgi:hypothetical protein
LLFSESGSCDTRQSLVSEDVIETLSFRHALI